MSTSEIFSAKYDVCRNLIKKHRQHGVDWQNLRFANQLDERGLCEFLDRAKKEHLWPENLDVQIWYELVRSEEHAEQRRIALQERNFDSRVIDSRQDNAVEVPADPRSAWQLYRKNLRKSGFSSDAITNIEKATIGILRRLSTDTSETGPIKGLVIGQVQSGKTANMAALMAMAADHGWNFFIVLSGTIENLRIQTQRRLLNDLNHPGNLQWIGLNHLSPRGSYGERVMDLHFEDESVARYFNVCLKNSRRLENLIRWMRQDPRKVHQMKVLVIDDEADHASINTADVCASERRKVNDLIVKLVEGLPLREGQDATSVQAMNYISYTATPYANFLNESTPESLYPRHFIWTLPTSDEYFGPKQIFGSEDINDSDGLDVIRSVPVSDLYTIAKIHRGEQLLLPESLKDAFCWLLCAAACMRHWEYKKPVSMLIHTSRKQMHHDNVAEALRSWLASTPEEQLVSRSRTLWIEETSRFTTDSFKDAYPDYRRLDQLRDYPMFEEIEEHIRVISKDMMHIYLDEDDELHYHDYVHLCIDNCSYNSVTVEGEYVRLAYPNEEREPAPVFVVIGGNTLSRGLTIEGLVSTYFVRDAKQADSLMQMGRWFGYRRDYEMLPRIWLTDDLIDKFTFLTTLELELRQDLYRFMKAGADPAEYGPRVKNTPRPSWLRVTAANRMQSAMEVDMDFTGTSTQTISFPNDRAVLEENIKVAEGFLNKLGAPKTSKNALVWSGVPFAKISKELLSPFHFGAHNRVFNEIEVFSEWVESVSSDEGLTDWNVIVAGVGLANDEKRHPSKSWFLRNGSVGKVNRTRKVSSASRTNMINIGVLGAPRDLLADTWDRLPQDIRTAAEQSTDTAFYRAERSKVGLDKTPQLIIYRIDKDSRLTQKSKSGQRADLEAEADIVGMWIHIPGSASNRGRYARAVTIRLDRSQTQNEELHDLEE